MILLRSILFTLLFYAWAAVSCMGLAWSLPFRRSTVLFFTTRYLGSVSFLERAVLGLHHEVHGLENLPASGSFLIAAKHQSAWETLKLHLLFNDPGVVLKRELMDVPLWGAFARAMGGIPVDRGSGPKAVAGMVTAARRVAREGRPIVIFPQGTRVAPGAYEPYKAGAGILYDKLKIPVVPMALNSGVFWPRHRWRKRPGCIIVEFLPPIPPGRPRAEMMADLETRLEAATDRLVTAAGGPATVRPDPAAAVAVSAE